MSTHATARSGRRRRTMLAAGVAAVVLALALQASGALTAVELRSVDARFSLRGASEPTGITVVAIDDATFAELETWWPFTRTRHARAVDQLRKAGARLIVYDVQFTEPSDDPEADLALYDSIDRAGGAILATGESDAKGRTNVLGGDDNLASIDAKAAASNLPADGVGVIRRYGASSGRLATIATAVARRMGRPLASSAFDADGTAWIDFHGSPGTVPTISFSDLVAGRAPTELLRDRIVVVGAAAPTLQDVHATSATDKRLMSGPEIQANAISTALRGNPLRDVSAPIGIAMVLLAGLSMPLLALRLSFLRCLVGMLALAGLLLASAHLAFAAGWVVPVTAPLVALGLVAVGGTVAAYTSEALERRRVTRYSVVLEAEVASRTADMRELQLELVRRLGQAAEFRDGDTGAHLERMSRLAGDLALAAGMPADQATLVEQASLMHDIGKIGISDRVLRKAGALSDAERAEMELHTQIGAEILGGSRWPLLQAAEVIARHHHENWDGTGYPSGLRGEAIPRPARISAICDVFDALVSARAYKRAWSIDEALEEIRAQAGHKFDPGLVHIFCRLVTELRDEIEPSLTAERENLPFFVDVAEPSTAPAKPHPARTGSSREEGLSPSSREAAKRP